MVDARIPNELKITDSRRLAFTRHGFHRLNQSEIAVDNLMRLACQGRERANETRLLQGLEMSDID